MNSKFLFDLAAISTAAGVLAIVGLMTESVAAAEANRVLFQANAGSASCDIPVDSSNPSIQSLLHTSDETLIASAASIPLEHPDSNFSEAESDAAVTLFGCDCLACIGALRQLRSQTLLGNGSGGHCLVSLQRRVSEAEMQEVLQQLEAAEAIQEN